VTLQGVSRDVQRYREFLLSDHGGAWNNDEVRVLEEPDRDELQRVLERAGTEVGFALTIGMFQRGR